MSSPGSAISSAAITRAPSVADGVDDIKKGDKNGDNDAADADAALPERLRFLLAQSTVYSNIIADKMLRETEERRRKEGRAVKRRENKAAAASNRPTTTRKTRNNASKAAGKPAQTAREGSLLSSQDDSETEKDVKAHDFAEQQPVKRKVGRPRKEAASAKGKGKQAAKKAETSSEEEAEDVVEPDDEGQTPLEAKKEDEEGEAEADKESRQQQVEPDRTMQPRIVTGATMKTYQVSGMEWLISLYENGLNGILADEMGLGKTLQTIAFLAYLREKGVWGPFLVCCPLSTLANWVNEFERFTPDIPVLLYHGTPQERATLRAERMSPPTNEKVKNVKNKKGAKTKGAGKFSNTTATFPVIVTSYELVINDRRHLSSYNWKFLIVDESHRIKNLNCKLIKELMSYKSANRLLLTGTPLQNNLEELWSLLNFLMPEIFDDLDSFKSWFNIDVSASSTAASNHIITKLHAILKPFLLRRVKREVEKGLPPKKEYLLSAPVTLQQKKLYDAVIKRQIRDFLLSKKELLPDANKENGTMPFSEDDEELPNGPTMPKSNGKGKKGKAAINGSSSKKRKAAEDEEDPASAKKAKTDGSTPVSEKRARPNYAPVSNEDFLESLDDGSARDAAEAFEQKRYGHIYASAGGDAADGSDSEATAGELGKEAAKKISGLKLSNMVMQLRKVVNHPWLFDWPTDPKTGEAVLDDTILTSSGKMMLLERLLDELFATGHKVLVFSQFTKQLDIIEDWAVDWKGWNICRIDGTTKQEDRRSQLKDFNENTGPDAASLFLLSTRSGGVGINLTGADTVILFDSDWNPQMDLQAMDRAHRLGQKNPVLVFRLVTANSIEAKMLERAGAKRKLEALVIGSGKYTTSLEDLQDIFTGNTSKGKSTGVGEEKAAGLAAQMFAEEMRDQSQGKELRIIKEGEEVISEAQLQALLDRSDEAMGRGKGWKVEEGEETQAIEVIETVAAGDEDGNDTLADLFKNGESAPGTPHAEEGEQE